MKKESSPEAHTIRRQVLLALAANRAPGFHFPGHLLALAWPRIGENDLEEVMPDGPQARNVDGSANLAAFCVHLDTARSAAPKHPQLSVIAAWYISPGQGKALKIRSKRIHEGRSFAAVHTEVRNADGSRVLEVVSHHAA